jgi:ribonuclease Z
MNIQLAIHSSPRFSTWIWVPDWRLMVDAGDGVTQQLGYKIRKIDTVLCTHAHRDHIGGLLQVINQRGEAGAFAVAHPCGSHSFDQLAAFSNKFNPGTSWNAIWHKLEEGDVLETGIEGRLIQSFRTRHYADDNPNAAPRSLGFHLLWRKQKVRPEYRDLTQSELDTLRRQKGAQAILRPEFARLETAERAAQEALLGREAITEPIDEKWLSIGGDGCPLSPDEVRDSKVLLHEATFLSPDDYDAEEGGEDVGHVHSTVYDALRVAHEAGVETVLLYHISTRYTDAEIKDAIRETAAHFNLNARVWAALPRRVCWNVFAERPLWEGQTAE